MPGVLSGYAGAGDYHPDSYLKAMQKNIDLMREALEGQVYPGD